MKKDYLSFMSNTSTRKASPSSMNVSSLAPIRSYSNNIRHKALKSDKADSNTLTVTPSPYANSLSKYTHFPQQGYSVSSKVNQAKLLQSANSQKLEEVHLKLIKLEYLHNRFNLK